MTGPAFDTIVRALVAHGHKVTMQGPGRARTTCTHDGANNPDALSIVDMPDRVGLHCFTRECDPLEILESVGLTIRDRYHDPKGPTYHYDDGRMVHRSPEKRFRQSGNTKGTPTLYRLTNVCRAVAEGKPVYLVEGESDALALESLGLTATTAPMGATNFDKVDVKPLAGADVVAIVDRDQAGERWAAQVVDKLAGVAQSVTFQHAATGKDASDHVAAGLGSGDFVTIRPRSGDADEQGADGAEGDALGAAEGPMSTWRPVDLGPYLSGTHQSIEPTLLARTDGVRLLYRGCTHSMHGESESGKSLVMQAEAALLVNAGEAVLYVDFESDAESVLARLMMFGASPECLLEHLDYIAPEDSPFTDWNRGPWREILAHRYALAVIDGVTDAVGVFGYSSKDNDELSTWQREFPDALAKRTGAAVVSIDHVTKDSEGRGRFAIGGQAKMAGLTGAAYTVEVSEPLGIGMRGVVVLRIAKDRPGQVRPHCGGFRKSDRTQEAARVIFDATGPAEIVRVEPWSDSQSAVGTSTDFRPTELMERVSMALEAAAGPLSFRQLNDLVSGREQYVKKAVNALIAEGYVSTHPGARNAIMHTLIAQYRQAGDPVNDTGDGHILQTTVVCLPSKDGRTGDRHSPSPGDARATVGDGQVVGW